MKLLLLIISFLIVIALVIPYAEPATQAAADTATYEEPTTVISVMWPDLENYVFKYEGTKLYWAYETTCKEVVYHDCIGYDGEVCNNIGCMCSDLIRREETECDWSPVIPGPLLRELLK